MKKIIFLTLFLISILVLSLRLSSLPAKFLTVQPKAGIKVFSLPEGADVYIDGISVGKTPFESLNLESQEVTLKIETKDLTWSGIIKLNPGTISIVNRELSSGEVLNLTKGDGVNLISNPQGSEVEIDGLAVGKTPIYVHLGSGEHLFVFSKNGFLKRSIKAVIPLGFNLGLSVDLAISELDLTNVVTSPITTTPKLKVLSTPTGFLRVRDKPNLGGSEVGRVSQGDELILLEDLSSWFKVRLSGGKEGYVSSQYVEKVIQ